MATRRVISVLKIGGSLITDRRRYRVARPRAIDRMARAIGGWRARAPGDVLIVLGGGSFGHNVVDRHGLDPGGAHRSPCEVFELTAALYELKASFAAAMRRHGVPAMPLQETGLFTSRDEALALANPKPIEACFAAGYVPLVTGGLMVGDRGLLPVGSDGIALPLLGPFAVRRVVMLTDRPGIMRGDRVVRKVTPQRFDRIMSIIDAPKKLDVTGGMRGKFAAAVELARRGVETVIAGGAEITPAWLESVFSRRPPGTLVVAVKSRS